MGKATKKELTLKWVVTNGENIAKFTESNDVYAVSDEAANIDYEKAGVNPGAKVTVIIDESVKNDDTAGLITKMTLANNSEPTQPETKTETSGTSNSTEGTVLTLKTNLSKYNGVIFAEEDGVWYTLNDGAVEQFKKNNMGSGNKVAIVYKESKGKKYIDSISLVAEPKATTTPSKTDTTPSQTSTKTYTASGTDTQKSIEAQAAVNAANATVAKLFAGKFDEKNPEDGAMVRALITAIAKHNHQLVQQLKNS